MHVLNSALKGCVYYHVGMLLDPVFVIKGLHSYGLL